MVAGLAPRWLVFVILFVVSPCFSYHRHCYWAGRCWRGLFMDDTEWAKMNTTHGIVFNKLFRLKHYRAKVKFNETCGAVNIITSPQGVEMMDCSANHLSISLNSSSVRKRSVCESCCMTEMSFSVPQTVTDEYTLEEHDVKHFTSAFQLISLGECVNQGGVCGLGGTCDQAYRIDWMLVNTTSGDTFVPVSIPSHCTCIYS